MVSFYTGFARFENPSLENEGRVYYSRSYRLSAGSVGVSYNNDCTLPIYYNVHGNEMWIYATRR